MKVDLVGVAREEVAALIVVRTPGNDRLAGGLEALDRRADLAQARRAAAVEIVEHEDQARDARILGRRVDSGQHVAQSRFARAVTDRVGQRRLVRAASELLDEIAAQRQHERGVVLEFSAVRADPREPQEPQQQQEQDVQDEASREVEQ